MTNFKKITFLITSFVTFAFTNLKAISIEIVDNAYSEYNIIESKIWRISPYAFVGYSFEYAPFTSKEGIAHYSSMIKGDHHGYIIGAGLTINKNWMFGISFQQTIKNSQPSADYANIVEGVRSELLMTNVDIAVKMPFSFVRNHLEFLILGGANIIVSGVYNNYQDNLLQVPVEFAKKNAQASFGVNLGLGARFNFLKFFHVGVDVKRLFILTSKTSLIKDTWLINAVVGVTF